ncbi:MAG: ABC transporter permease [Chloroflexota bacterium]|nr:ABC transporter permease [Chloroflexota bacterium]
MSAAGQAVLSAPAVEPRRSAAGLWSDAFYRLRRDRTSIVALAVLALIVLLALGADALATSFFHESFTHQDLLESYDPPSLAKPSLWLGTDEIGRSQIVRLLYGARVSLAVGAGAGLIDLTVGIAIGLSSGYFRGWWDDLMQFLISTLNSIPALFLLLFISVLFSPGPVTIVAVIGFLTWSGIALYVRGQTFSLREREFVTAARVVGADDLRVMVRHILPNVLPLVIVLAAIDVGQAILIESALSYLGLGIDPPTPSWGNMLQNATQDLTLGPWLVWGPGLAISVTVLCLYLAGDGIRDALDPRLRGTE